MYYPFRVPGQDRDHSLGADADDAPRVDGDSVKVGDEIAVRSGGYHRVGGPSRRRRTVRRPDSLQQSCRRSNSDAPPEEFPGDLAGRTGSVIPLDLDCRPGRDWWARWYRRMRELLSVP